MQEYNDDPKAEKVQMLFGDRLMTLPSSQPEKHNTLIEGGTAETLTEKLKKVKPIKTLSDQINEKMDADKKGTQELTLQEIQRLCKKYGFSTPKELYERYPHLKPKGKIQRRRKHTS